MGEKTMFKVGDKVKMIKPSTYNLPVGTGKELDKIAAMYGLNRIVEDDRSLAHRIRDVACPNPKKELYKTYKESLKSEDCLLGPKTGCSHEWKTYNGLMNSFDYCSKCDEKKT